MNSNFAQSVTTAMVVWDLVPRAGIWPAAWLAIELTIRELKSAPIGASLLIYAALSVLSLVLR
jgi:hypothetical protein